jgi:hypothetical protein
MNGTFEFLRDQLASMLIVFGWCNWCLCGHSLLLVVVSSLATAAARAVDLPLGEGTVIRFADARQGVMALTRRDDYIRHMSPFDRQARLRTDRDVSEEEFLAFVAQHVMPWEEGDIRKLTPLLADLDRKLRPWKLLLPAVVLLIKTTGREESGAAYCRGPAIVLPQNMLNAPREKLEQVLPHEVFHVLSNQNPELREKLYAIIGFRPCNEVQLPEPLASRKITNPDAPVNDYFQTLTVGDRAVECMPMLFSKSARYDTQRGGDLFSYLDFKLMELESDGTERRPLMRGDRPVVLDPASTPSFHDQIGRNTTYNIHPEEVLAENFVLLLNGRINVPTPRVVETMGKVLQDAAAP